MAALGTLWSPESSPATSYGGRPSGTPHDGEATEQEEGRGEVPEDGVLTLSTMGCSMEAEVDGRRRNRGGGVADGGEEDETDAAM